MARVTQLVIISSPKRKIVRNVGYAVHRMALGAVARRKQGVTLNTICRVAMFRGLVKPTACPPDRGSTQHDSQTHGGRRRQRLGSLENFVPTHRQPLLIVALLTWSIRVGRFSA